MCRELVHDPFLISRAHAAVQFRDPGILRDAAPQLLFIIGHIFKVHSLALFDRRADDIRLPSFCDFTQHERHGFSAVCGRHDKLLDRQPVRGQICQSADRKVTIQDD